jgi:hypothetical protein
MISLTLALAGLAYAQTAAKPPPGVPPTERLSPQERSEALSLPLTTAIKRQLIEPFLAEPMVIDEAVALAAPRIVAAQEGRVLLSRGDRAYARSVHGSPLELKADSEQRFSVFRHAKALKDPTSGEVLGYEAQFIGTAVLVASEGSETVQEQGREVQRVVPATLLITGANEEIRAGDRLLVRTSERRIPMVPHPAVTGTVAQIISVYGSAVVNAGSNQVIVVNQGRGNGLEPGHVMAIQKRRTQTTEANDPTRTPLLLPEERNGLAMVFLSFEKVSYALVVQVTDSVRVGDRLTAP